MAPPDSAPLSHEPPFVRSKWRFLPAILIFVAITGAAAFFIVRAGKAVKPQRVLIAIDVGGYWWNGSAAAATVSDRLAARLSKLGFDVVKGGDPEASKILEKSKSLREAADQLHAGFLIEAKIVPEIIKHDVGGGYVELRVDSKVTLTYAGEAPKEVGHIVSFSGAAELKEARKLIADSVSDQAMDAVIAPMVQHPAIVEITSKRATNESALLAPAVEWVDRRDKIMKKTMESYDAARAKRVESEKGNPRPTFLSAPSAHDELAGVGPKGFLASTNDIRPFFFPETEQMGWLVQLEAVEWRKVDAAVAAGSAGELQWKGYNIFGYPSSQGDRAVLVEDLFGLAKTITVVDAAGAKPRRIKFDPEHRFIDPKLSPGGKFVATWDRSCPSCAGDLLVLAADTGAVVFQANRENGGFGSFAWLDDHRLVFVHTTSGDDADAKLFPRPKPKVEPGKDGKDAKNGKNGIDAQKAKPTADELTGGSTLDPEEQPKLPAVSVWTLDCAASPASAAVLAEPIEVPPLVGVETLAVQPGGKLVVFGSGRSKLTSLDMTTGTFGEIAIEGFARWPAFSPDGKLIVFEQRNDYVDNEIALVPTAGGKTLKLTLNEANDRLPTFSSDGRFVLYETIEEDPNFPKTHNLSWVASIPVPTP